MKPTLHLTNWSSRTLHGPGPRYTIMARPSAAWEHGDGRVTVLLPDLDHLATLKRNLKNPAEYPTCVADYREHYQAHLREYAGLLAPGTLMASVCCGGGMRELVVVPDGATLCCVCSRAAAARDECHRVWAARSLVAAGWRVILDGAEL